MIKYKEGLILYNLNTNPLINHRLSKSLETYFHDEFRNSSVLPYSIPSKTTTDDIVFAYNGDYALIKTQLNVES